MPRTRQSATISGVGGEWKGLRVDPGSLSDQGMGVGDTQTQKLKTKVPLCINIAALKQTTQAMNMCLVVYAVGSSHCDPHPRSATVLVMVLKVQPV